MPTQQMDQGASKDAAASVELIRERLNPLYESEDFLGFTVMDDAGEIICNDSFLSDEAALNAAQIFYTNKDELAKSERVVDRVTVEMNDIIVIFQAVAQGLGLFICSADGSIDAAMEVISELGVLR